MVFEDEECTSFETLNLLRHTSQLRWGTRTLLESFLKLLPGSTPASLWGRSDLAAVTTEDIGIAYNEGQKGTVLLLNARARPERSLASLATRRSRFAAFSGGSLLAARLDATKVKPGILGERAATKIGKEVERLEAPPESMFRNYWDLVERNGLGIAEQAYLFEDPLTLPASVGVKGPPSNLRVHGRSDVEFHVTLDARLGPIIIEDGASVESFSRLTGPCYIGPKSRLYSALIGGGTSVFQNCRVGGQVENSILMPHTNKAHFGYLGDSYVGEWVNLGAGSTFSNLKNTYGNVRVEVGGTKLDSGLLKLGPAVGDMCKVSIGALVYAGKLVGTGSQVSGLANRNVPSFTFYDGTRGMMVELLESSVIDTQRRMMERRGMVLGRSREKLIRSVFHSTSRARRKEGTKRGKIG